MGIYFPTTQSFDFKMIEGVGDQLLEHRSAYKQSHGHHRSGSLTIKINEVVQLAPVTCDKSA